MINALRFIVITVLLFIISNRFSYGQSTSYHTRYSTNVRNFGGKEQIKTQDNGSLIVGKWGQGDEDSTEIMLIKLNETGSVMWSKAFPLSPRVENFSVCEMADRSIALAVDLEYNVNYHEALLVMKLNCAGDVQWSNRVYINTAVERTSYPMSIREGKNGDLILSSYSAYTTGALSTSSVCRIDNSGNLVWSKTFRGTISGTDQSVNYTAAAFYQDDKVFVFGFRNFYSNYVTLNKQLYAMKLNYNNGAVETQQSYNYSEFYTTGELVTEPRTDFNAGQLTDKTFALFGIFALFSNTNFYLYKIIINSDLSIKQTQLHVIPSYIGLRATRIAVFPNGETHIFSSDYETETCYWYSANSANTSIRQKKIPFSQSVLYNVFGDHAFQTGDNRSAFCVSHIIGSQYYIDQEQVENGDNNILSCLGTDTTLVQLQPMTVTTGAWSWTSVTDNELSAAAFPISAVPIAITTEYICKPTNPVLAFGISGPTSICSTSNTYTYQVSGSPVQWKIDPQYYDSFQQVNDSTVTIAFKSSTAPYMAKLYASGNGVCAPVQDSIEINVYPGPSIPATITSCTLNFTVHCGNWFKSYHWQDGSADSVYTISKAGQYTVDLTTYCNEVITRTINASSNKAGLPGKVSICQNDTVALQAPDGLLNYSWTPDYDAYHASDKELDVYPQKDTLYVLASETPDGCKLKDTVLVSVKERPVVNIGPDTVVCVQEGITLSANGTFASYLWNTGAVSPSITVADGGQYTLTVTAADGCTASDTVAVTGKVCVHEIDFPNAFTPNHDGRNDIFKPLIKGHLENFELVIYNRWGQLVFRTNSQVAGWDGTLNGQEQNTGTYVWMCRYKFINEPTKTARGSITIIK